MRMVGSSVWSAFETQHEKAPEIAQEMLKVREFLYMYRLELYDVIINVHIFFHIRLSKLLTGDKGGELCSHMDQEMMMMGVIHLHTTPY